MAVDVGLESTAPLVALWGCPRDGAEGAGSGWAAPAGSLAAGLGVGLVGSCPGCAWALSARVKAASNGRRRNKVRGAMGLDR